MRIKYGCCDTPFAPLGLAVGWIRVLLYTFRPAGACSWLDPRVAIHLSPRWGLQLVGSTCCYTPFAPLGLVVGWIHALLYTFRPSGACSWLDPRVAIHLSPRWDLQLVGSTRCYTPFAPLGLAVGWIHVLLYTFRPAGACSWLDPRVAIHLSPRWGL